ncbi:hypothetical protein EV702DRAFT_1253476 [Suillus placidus]|uniref:Uncharacterized protein n=1 Tax=Suillus placidus TaxID=48579 RepID=A0A9P6ZJ16_9AGAM|nr:hypothetical protein EV702DRAFT_1253476 [Suillus placidus]
MSNSTTDQPARGTKTDEARSAGAHIVGGIELADGIVSGKHDATTILCSAALIWAITPKLGRVLGPRGLMPSGRRWTSRKATRMASFGCLLARQFVAAVKRVSGNQKDADEKGKSKSVKPASMGNKPKVAHRKYPLASLFLAVLMVYLVIASVLCGVAVYSQAGGGVVLLSVAITYGAYMLSSLLAFDPASCNTFY